jgi:hypothetical protein
MSTCSLLLIDFIIYLFISLNECQLAPLHLGNLPEYIHMSQADIDLGRTTGRGLHAPTSQLNLSHL